MLSVKEYKGVVIDNVDLDGKSRLQVFLLGYHDLTGTKTKVKDLKWLFPKSSSTTTTSLPKIGQIVNVTYNDDSDPLSQGYWTLSSHYTKNDSALKSILPFLVYDTESKKFITDFNEGYNNKSQLEELKYKKNELEGNIQALKEDLGGLRKTAEERVQNFSKTIEIEKLELKKSHETILNNNNNTILEYKNKTKEIATKALDEFDVYYEENYKNQYGDMDALSENNQNQYRSLLDKFFEEKGYKQSVVDLNKQIATLNALNSGEEEAYKSRLERINNTIPNININLEAEEKTIQSLIEQKSLELEDVNTKIKNLESSSTSGDAATSANTKATQAFSTDQNIETEYNEKTGILYGYIDGKKRIIGNWTGLYMYTPGFFGQPGEPVYKKIEEAGGLYQFENSRIKETSYLLPSDPLAANRGDTTANHPAENPSIKKSDNDKTWNCDISYETRLKILTKRKNLMSALQWIRDKISALLTDASGSSTARWVRATATLVTNILKGIQKFLKFINEIILEIALITAQIRQLITWILSLPARLLALLQDCITHFFNSISDAFSESLGTGLGGQNVAFSEVTELVSQAQSTFNTALETVEATTIVYTEIKTIEATFEKV